MKAHPMLHTVVGCSSSFHAQKEIPSLRTVETFQSSLWLEPDFGMVLWTLLVTFLGM